MQTEQLNPPIGLMTGCFCNDTGGRRGRVRISPEYGGWRIAALATRSSVLIGLVGRLLATEVLHVKGKRREGIRAVLTDIMMPFGDGWQLMTMLYQPNPGLAIIARSGQATSAFHRKTLKRGARAFVAKLISAAQILAALSTVLRPAASGG